MYTPENPSFTKGLNYIGLLTWWVLFLLFDGFCILFDLLIYGSVNTIKVMSSAVI